MTGEGLEINAKKIPKYIPGNIPLKDSQLNPRLFPDLRWKVFEITVAKKGKRP